MMHLFARENVEVLAQLAWAKVLLAFDFDGTLAPIVSAREKAGMRESTQALFTRLCILYPCAVLSGRSCADLATRLGRAKVKYVVGNHGLEPGPSLPRFEREARRARVALEAALSSVAGIDIEDKRYSLAVHYRGARFKEAARTAIEDAVHRLPTDMRIVPGKLVINVIPKRAPDKGQALLGLRAAARSDTALYVGDDVTDEDVFELDQPGRLITVRVGESRSSAALYFLRGQREIDRLLAALVRLREGVRPHEAAR